MLSLTKLAHIFETRNALASEHFLVELETIEALGDGPTYVKGEKWSSYAYNRDKSMAFREFVRAITLEPSLEIEFRANRYRT